MDLPEKFGETAPVTVACCADTAIVTNSNTVNMLMVANLFIFAFEGEQLIMMIFSNESERSIL
jgi:hypothetical protein